MLSLLFAGSNQKLKERTILCFCVRTSYIGKFCFTSFSPKYSCSIRSHDSSIRSSISREKIRRYLGQHVTLLLLVQCFHACPVKLRLSLTCYVCIWLAWAYAKLKIIQNERSIDSIGNKNSFFTNEFTKFQINDQMCSCPIKLKDSLSISVRK